MLWGSTHSFFEHPVEITLVAVSGQLSHFGHAVPVGLQQPGCICQLQLCNDILEVLSIFRLDQCGQIVGAVVKGLGQGSQRNRGNIQPDIIQQIQDLAFE